MTEDEKAEKRENFTNWVTFIEDRVNDRSADLPEAIRNALDYSPQSLKIVEPYILSEYGAADISDPAHKIAIDALISYCGETFRRNLPGCVWEIDLENEDNIDFNRPVIATPIGTNISPHHLIRRALFKNQGTFLFDHYETRLGFIQNPETY